jgi:hypothetical protein
MMASHHKHRPKNAPALMLPSLIESPSGGTVTSVFRRRKTCALAAAAAAAAVAAGAAAPPWLFVPLAKRATKGSTFLASMFLLILCCTVQEMQEMRGFGFVCVEKKPFSIW